MNVSPASEPTEIVGGKLWALGGVAQASDGVSWLGPTFAGEDPVSCYLAIEDDRALLVDTGTAAHSDIVVSQLEALLDPKSRFSIFLTRGELDVLSGLGPIIDRFNLEELILGDAFATNPLEFFYGSADKGIAASRKSAGDSIYLSETRSISILQPTLRLLLTNWLYDGGTKTLFTSDVFGHMHLTDTEPLDSFSRIASDDAGSLQSVREHLYAKFEWLRYIGPAEASYISKQIEEVFAVYQVEIIAPAHGCVVKGADAVERSVRWMLDALQSPHPSQDDGNHGAPKL